MAKPEFPSPRHWEDWVGLALGVWLFVSPWVLQYGGTPAAKNAFLVGYLLITTELIALAAFLIWEEWVSGALGAWLVISPWVLGAALVPMVNFVIVGLLVLALALYEIWDERWHVVHSA